MSSEREELSAIIAEYVPPFVLLELRHSQVELDVGKWRNEAVSDPSPALHVARRVVDAFADNNVLSDLAKTLYRRLSSDDLAAGKFVPFVKNDADDNQQAALAYRALMLEQAKLRQFLAECEPRICLIFAPGDKGLRKGTGFLIGPSTVLTAWHVVKEAIKADEDGLKQCCAVFDHLSGPALNALEDIPDTARKVMFAPDWRDHPTMSEDFPDDGTLRSPNAEEIAQLRGKLDFAVVKLAEPIGSQACNRNGGRRRGWFRIDGFRPPQTDQRIIIPQHPMGFRQQIDFGRYREQCPSETRIRYDTETANGTSGAPCFDENYRLVGMHNAAYRPDKIDLYNQAIRFDWIAKLLPEAELEGNVPAAAPIWSTSTVVATPILGRRLLIDWIDRAMSASAPVADQIFAVEGKLPKSGRNFSIDILREKVRAEGDRVVELGTLRAPLPATVEDVMATILDQLALPRSVIAGMPPRPSADDTDGSKKLATWASKEIPDWFERVLAEHRQFSVNLLDFARQLQALGQAAFDASATEEQRNEGRAFRLTPEQQAILDAGVDKVASRSRWELIWIALRLRTGQKLPEELSNLLAQLARTVEGSASEFTRIRWLFIESLPEFVTILDPRSKEVLDPTAIGKAEITACWRSLADAANLPFSDDDPTIFGVINFLPTLETNLSIEKRLPTFQALMANLATGYRQSLVQRGLIAG